MSYEHLLRQYGKSVPRWVVLIIDLLICAASSVLSYLIISNFYIDSLPLTKVMYALMIIVPVRYLSFLVSKTYYGVIRFAGFQDSLRIFATLFSGTAVLVLINQLEYYINSDPEYLLPHSLIIVDFFISLVAMTFSRMGYRLLYNQLKTSDTNKKTNVIIYGAGNSGITTKRTLDLDTKINYKVVAFIDDDPKKLKHRIDGVSIYAADSLEKLIDQYKVHELIISIQNISKQKKIDIVEQCLAQNIKVKNIPPVERWINGELSAKQIKSVKIEELLDRDEIKLDVESIGSNVNGKTILITGAAGSIGSEIVRQLLAFNPKKLILFDQAETPVYELENELTEKFVYTKVNKNIEIIVGDIRNYYQIKSVFHRNRIDMIYHAAAYKHVPLMEENPISAVNTNVYGTKIIADLAVEYSVPKFVMVSTDKAVNPTNVMGASKRIAEIYVQSLNYASHNQTTAFITTRFGNVLGSNGSVIPYFKKQIENGGPVTVTHPEITRYFMTIPEACQLVIEAGNMGDGGEIFIFDMGKPVKIVDLAKKMIKLSGLTLGKDIKIVFSGLRVGEKLKEELLNNSENTIPTHHPKILIATIQPVDFEIVTSMVNDLLDVMYNDNAVLVKQMKRIVPEFISNNSVFSSLDIAKI